MNIFPISCQQNTILKSCRSANFKGNNQIIEKEDVPKEFCEFRRTISALKADLKALELKKIFCSGLGDKKGAEQCAKMIEEIKKQISDFL